MPRVPPPSSSAARRRTGKVLSAFSAAVEKVLQKAYAEKHLIGPSASYGARLRGLEDFESLCVALADGVFGGYCAMDSFKMLQSVTPEECVDFIRHYLGTDSLALSVILPEKV